MSPHPLPRRRRPPPDTTFTFSRAFTWREEGPQDLGYLHGLPAAPSQDTTSWHAKPVPPALLFTCLPHQQDRTPASSPQASGCHFLGGKGPDPVEPSSSHPLPPVLSTCPSWGSALLLPQQLTIQTSPKPRTYSSQNAALLRSASALPPRGCLSSNLRRCWSPLLQKYTKLLHNYFPNN